MSRQKLKARDKITQKMSRDGLVERNETKGEDNRISNRDVEIDLRGESPERQALSQVGTRSGAKLENRTKSKQRQIESFLEKETAKSETPQNGTPSRNVQSSADIPHPSGEGQRTIQQQQDVHENAYGMPQPSDSTLRHKSETVAFVAEPEAPSIIHNIPRHESVTPSVNPRDPPKQKSGTLRQDSLSHVETRSDKNPVVPQNTALRQDKPTALQLKPVQAVDTTNTHRTTNAQNVQPKQSGKLKTQKESVLQHNEPVAATVVIDNVGTSEQPLQTESGQATETAITDSGKKPQQPSGEGKRRVQGTSAYRQKNLAIPVIEPKTPDSSVVHRQNGQPQLTVGNPSAQSNVQGDTATNNKSINDGWRDNEDKTSPDTPIQPKPNINNQTSQLTSDKPGKLKFGKDESVPDKPKVKPDKKLAKAERQMEQANDKLAKARSELPGKKKLRSERVFDEQTGKSSQKLQFHKEITPQGEHLKGALPLRPVKMAANAGIAKFHSKMFQVEHENVEVKAAHRTEMAAEGGVRSALRFRKTAKYRKVAKLERQAAKKSINLTYRKALAENPKLRSNVFSRIFQKRKIRKEYAKKARDAKRAAGVAKKSVSTTVKVTRFLVKAVAKNPKVWIVAGVIGLIIIILMSLFSLATSIGSGGLSAVLASTHLAEAEDIEAAALAYSEWETDLRLEILNVETSHPGFDEYRFDIGVIGHCPIELMAFLTAVYHDFTFDEIQAYMRALFDEQYTLTFTPSVEVRYAPSEPDGELIPFDWHVMTVTLTSRSFSEVLQSNMTFDQQAHFNFLMQTKGNRQIVGSPFDFYWRPFISSHYGWRVHPISGERNMHRGIDIGLPTGTPILAAHSGVVTVSEYMGGFGNVVFIVGENGIETRYAHADTLLVNVGDTVEMGDIIATVGSTGDSTGPHLHFEILVDGSHVNPAFFAFMGG